MSRAAAGGRAGQNGATWNPDYQWLQFPLQPGIFAPGLCANTRAFVEHGSSTVSPSFQEGYGPCYAHEMHPAWSTRS